MKNFAGFTLIELIVVIGIMAILLVVSYANFKTLGNDDNLKSTVANFQSAIRSAQTNASANVKCNNTDSLTWSLKLTGAAATELDTFCTQSWPTTTPTPTYSPKIYKSNNSSVQIDGVYGDTGNQCDPITINFSLLTGRISTVISGGTNCTTSLKFTAVFRNTSTAPNVNTCQLQSGGVIPSPVPDGCKYMVIDRGGAVNVF